MGATSGGQARKELLPLTYTLSMDYAYGRNEKAQHVGNNSTVTFQVAGAASSTMLVRLDPHHAQANRVNVMAQQLAVAGNRMRYTL